LELAVNQINLIEIPHQHDGSSFDLLGQKSKFWNILRSCGEDRDGADITLDGKADIVLDGKADIVLDGKAGVKFC
jgi:hypothetical protein